MKKEDDTSINSINLSKFKGKHPLDSAKKDEPTSDELKKMFDEGNIEGLADGLHATMSKRFQEAIPLALKFSEVAQTEGYDFVAMGFAALMAAEAAFKTQPELLRNMFGGYWNIQKRPKCVFMKATGMTDGVLDTKDEGGEKASE